MNSIVIDMGKQLEGYTFRLHPLSRQWLQKQYPTTKPVKSIFISFDTRGKMDDIQSLMWPQILALLTGLSGLDELNQFSVINPVTGQEVYNSRSHHVQ
ncbi:MAG: hypothetical protein AAF639_05025 [Chloroflexota bacterium]